MNQGDKPTVIQLAKPLAWGSADLAREAGISIDTARRVYAAYEPSNRVKRAVCSALSRGLGREIRPGDIKWNMEIL